MNPACSQKPISPNGGEAAAEGSSECSLGQPPRLGCPHLKPALTNLSDLAAPLRGHTFLCMPGLCVSPSPLDSALSGAVAVPLWMLLRFSESSRVTEAGGTDAGTGKLLHNVGGGETLFWQGNVEADTGGRLRALKRTMTHPESPAGSGWTSPQG